jgi:hypothetical protein
MDASSGASCWIVTDATDAARFYTTAVSFIHEERLSTFTLASFEESGRGLLLPFFFVFVLRLGGI